MAIQANRVDFGVLLIFLARSAAPKLSESRHFLTLQERVLCFAANKLQTISFYFIAKSLQSSGWW